MKKENILKEVIKNGGLTVDYNLQPITKKSGFMVLLFGMETTVSLNDEELEKKLLEELERKISYILSTNKKNNLYIGFWIDNDILYMDISVLIVNKNNAIKKAIENMQLAIFDLQKNDSLYITYKVYTLYKVENDNLSYIWEAEDIQELSDFLGLESEKAIYKYIDNNINGYTIIIDEVPFFEDLES